MESLATSREIDRSIERARISVHQPSLAFPLALSALVVLALAPQLLLQHSGWFRSVTKAPRPEVIASFFALNSTVKGLPGDRLTWLWVASGPLAFAALGLAVGRRRWVTMAAGVAAAVLLGFPVWITARSGVSLSNLAKWGTCVSVLSALIAGAVAWKVPSGVYVRAVPRLFCAVVAVACLAAQYSARGRVSVGSASPEAAALDTVEAANQRDLLRVLLHLTPRERQVGTSLGALAASQQQTLDLVTDALGLTGEPGGVVVKSTEPSDDASPRETVAAGEIGGMAVVKLVPTITGAGSAVVNLLGGLPIAVEEVDGRWYVSSEASLKAIRR